MNNFNNTIKCLLIEFNNRWQLLVEVVKFSLEFLDDIDRSTALIDGRVLQYDASAGIWTGGIGGSSSGLSTETQTLDNVLALGGTSSRNLSVGVATVTIQCKWYYHWSVFTT